MSPILDIFFSFLPGGIQFVALILSIGLIGYIVKAMIRRFLYTLE
jgi:hypothetical protein